MTALSSTVFRVGRRWLFAVPVAAALLAATVQPTDGGFTICGLANCTGVACPGCGMTRAAGHLMRGNIAEALRYHPLVLVAVAELLTAWTIWAAHRAGWIRWRRRRWVDVALAATAVLFIVVWIARLITGTTPPV